MRYTRAMCGRAALIHVDEITLARILEIGDGGAFHVPNFVPRYNIAPTQPTWMLRHGVERKELCLGTWGLPHWKELHRQIINARLETMETSPFFRPLVRTGRAIVPVSGYYEWRELPKGTQPYYFTDETSSMMWLPALHDGKSFAVATIEANENVAPIHHRMPVKLTPEQAKQWLDGVPIREMRAQVEAQCEGWRFARHAVSTKVNKASFDDVSCIDPVPEWETAQQLKLLLDD